MNWKLAWTVCVALSAALAVFAAFWMVLLLVLYPGRIGSLGMLATSLVLEIVPAAEQALVLAIVALATRRPWTRAGLAAVLGLSLHLIPWALQDSLAGPGQDWLATARLAAVGALGTAIPVAMLPMGDILARGNGGGVRAMWLALAAGGGLAVIAWLASAGRDPFTQTWIISLFREAPFVWAWMSVPPPTRDANV